MLVMTNGAKNYASRQFIKAYRSRHYIYISVNPDKTFRVLKGQKLIKLVFRKGK